MVPFSNNMYAVPHVFTNFNKKFSQQFCKNFRVGEHCCEFECLDPPGEDNMYQVCNSAKYYCHKIHIKCAASSNPNIFHSTS